MRVRYHGGVSFSSSLCVCADAGCVSLVGHSSTALFLTDAGAQGSGSAQNRPQKQHKTLGLFSSVGVRLQTQKQRIALHGRSS